MSKYRYKCITVRAEEYQYFEEFLNRMAQDGWHLVRQTTAYLLKFRYDPELQLHYYTSINRDKIKLYRPKDREYDSGFTEFAEPFGYYKRCSVGYIDVYVHPHDQPLYTDPDLDVAHAFRMLGSLQRFNWVFAAIFACLIGLSLTRKYSILSSLPDQVFLLMQMVLVSDPLIALINYYRVKKGVFRSRRSKWRSLRSDFLSMLRPLLLIVFIGISVISLKPNEATSNDILLFLILLSACFILAKISLMITDSRMHAVGKWIGYGSVAVIWMFTVSRMLETFAFNDPVQSTVRLEPEVFGWSSYEEAYGTPSFLIEDQIVFQQDVSVRIVSIKSPVFKEYLKQQVMAQYNIAAAARSGDYTRITDPYGNEVFVLYENDTFVISWTPFSESVIENIKQELD